MTTPLWILAGGIALTCLVTTVVVLAALVVGARADRAFEQAKDDERKGTRGVTTAPGSMTEGR